MTVPHSFFRQAVFRPARHAVRPARILVAGLALCAAAPAPAITPPLDPNALGRAMSALPGLAACITQDGAPDPACARQQLARLTPAQRQALAAFAAFTAFYAEQTGGDMRGDWPPGGTGLPPAPTE